MADTEQFREQYKENTVADTHGKQSIKLLPKIYKFRVAPVRGNVKQFALQMPFSTLFDNLIAVLWSLYNKETTIKSGINQMQWALEFLKCLKVDYNYPESIGKIVKTIEKVMIEIYSKINNIQYKAKILELSIEKKDSMNNSKILDEYALYFNENDITKKLKTITIRMDRKSGEPRCIKELNELGKRKPKVEACKKDNKTSQTFVIGALNKILKKATEADTITEVEELLKELNIQNTTPAATKSLNKT
ncbi:uncharacterized protein LOC112591583 [Melanaphis sacchari]|uniref:uncharacterized protein LOC112591583 n=1 Tax=Melanaphis sacchari TaxID=742174 RepID=UPI000DC1514F|nr:uncharacterized protein LOC112591583 [Melanaphis sacchari]